MKSYDGLTIFVLGGRNGLIGWLVVQKLDRRYYYPNVPRYSQADAIALCGYLLSVKLRKEINFGDVWDKRRSFMMSALEEGILRTWHHGPIVCIGDSSNKVGISTLVNDSDIWFLTFQL
jgi:FAD dependent monooxygenase